jgi:hypothetical protein
LPLFHYSPNPILSQPQDHHIIHPINNLMAKLPIGWVVARGLAARLVGAGGAGGWEMENDHLSYNSYRFNKLPTANIIYPGNLHRNPKPSDRERIKKPSKENHMI